MTFDVCTRQQAGRHLKQAAKRMSVTPHSESDPLNLRYSYLNASIGSKFAARIAGIIPLTRPVTIRIPVATTTDMGEISNRISASSACSAISL